MPAIANYTMRQVIGYRSDAVGQVWYLRAFRDEFTVQSHMATAVAHDTGWYDNDVIVYKGSTTKNGIKGDSTVKSVSYTVANSSYLMDGATRFDASISPSCASVPADFFMREGEDTTPKSPMMHA